MEYLQRSSNIWIRWWGYRKICLYRLYLNFNFYRKTSLSSRVDRNWEWAQSFAGDDNCVLLMLSCRCFSFQIDLIWIFQQHKRSTWENSRNSLLWDTNQKGLLWKFPSAHRQVRRGHADCRTGKKFTLPASRHTRIKNMQTSVAVTCFNSVSNIQNLKHTDLMFCRARRHLASRDTTHLDLSEVGRGCQFEKKIYFKWISIIFSFDKSKYNAVRRICCGINSVHSALQLVPHKSQLLVFMQSEAICFMAPAQYF